MHDGAGRLGNRAKNELYELTTHARMRQQQRGVRRRQLDALMSHGDRRCRVGRGLVAITMSRQAFERAKGLIALQDLDRLRRLAVVVDPQTNCVVSVLHLHARGHRGRRYRATEGAWRRP